MALSLEDKRNLVAAMESSFAAESVGNQGWRDRLGAGDAGAAAERLIARGGDIASVALAAAWKAVDKSFPINGI